MWHSDVYCRRNALFFKHHDIVAHFLMYHLTPPPPRTPEGRWVKIGRHIRKTPLWNLQIHFRVQKRYKTWRYVYIFTTTYYETGLWFTVSDLVGTRVFVGDWTADVWGWLVTLQLVPLSSINMSSYRIQNNRTFLYIRRVRTEIISIRVSTFSMSVWTL
jgi:hypothetical protein